MKTIKWQISFVSISGTPYRIDIYADDYEGTPIQLLGGDSPFSTEEDASEDIFSPIRTQTGEIQVCTTIPEQTAYPEGGTLRMEDILPSNNIEHPIKLINTTDESIEWQGFLSCEVYNQQYTAIPQVLSLPIMSVLEAMDSVRIDYNTVKDINFIRRHLGRTIAEIDVQTGMTPFFTDVYYSRAAWNFLRRKIDATSLYEVNEYTNASSVTYVVDGISCKAMLTMLCQFMGWVCREQGTSLYFQRIGEEVGMCHLSPVSKLVGPNIYFVEAEVVSLVQNEIADLVWRGTDHQRSIKQGAKSVEVVAGLKKYEFGMGLPEYPTEDVIHGSTNFAESYVCENIDFNNSLTFLYYLVRIGNNGSHLSVIGTSDLNGAYGDCILNPSCDVAVQYQKFYSDQTAHPYGMDKRVGPFFAKVKFKNSEDWEDGLYITAINEMFATDEHAPAVFKMSSVAPRLLRNGSLEFTMNAMTVGGEGYWLLPFVGTAYVKVKFGNKYWNGSAWTTTETLWAVDFSQDVDEDSGAKKVTMPIDTIMSGEVSIEVIGSVKGGTTMPSGDIYPFYDLFVTELSLEYKQPEYVIESDRSDNHYYRILETNYSEEVSVSTELASNLNNILSPSLLLGGGDDAQPISFMPYLNADGSVSQIRPEIDLLNRLDKHYSQARQTLQLKVCHPSVALPLLKLRGINDGRTYLPLAESRDWLMEQSTLTCIELEKDEPSES